MHVMVRALDRVPDRGQRLRAIHQQRDAIAGDQWRGCALAERIDQLADVLAFVEIFQPLLHDALGCARRQRALAGNDRRLDALGRQRAGRQCGGRCARSADQGQQQEEEPGIAVHVRKTCTHQPRFLTVAICNLRRQRREPDELWRVPASSRGRSAEATASGSIGTEGDGGFFMLSWALTFFIVAIIAAVLGFTTIAGAAAGIAKILFFIFLVLTLVALVAGALRGRPPV
jgi:uncharacterized membrane protein YtjA (UPF0391 family)